MSCFTKERDGGYRNVFGSGRRAAFRPARASRNSLLRKRLIRLGRRGTVRGGDGKPWRSMVEVDTSFGTSGGILLAMVSIGSWRNHR